MAYLIITGTIMSKMRLTACIVAIFIGTLVW